MIGRLKRMVWRKLASLVTQATGTALRSHLQDLDLTARSAYTAKVARCSICSSTIGY